GWDYSLLTDLGWVLRGGPQQSGKSELQSLCTMSVSVLNPTRPLGGISGLLQVASLLGLVLLLLKAAQLYLRRQWLLKAIQEFPCPPSHWLYGHSQEAGRSRMGKWDRRVGQGSPDHGQQIRLTKPYRVAAMSAEPTHLAMASVAPLFPSTYSPCVSHWENSFVAAVLRSSQHLQKELLNKVEKFLCAYPCWLWGSEVLFIVYDPDYMKTQSLTGLTDSWLPGYGLLLLNGQMWFQHWWMLTPAFHYDILKPYMALMTDSVRVMLQDELTLANLSSGAFSGRVDTPGCDSEEQSRINDPNTRQDKWEEIISQDSHLEIFGYVSLMTLDPIMKCAFSHQSSIQRDRNSQSYIQAIGDLKTLFFHVRNASYQNYIIYRLTPDGRWNHRACQLTHQHTDGRALPTQLEKPLVSQTLPALQDGLGFQGPLGPDALHHHVHQGGTETLSTILLNTATLSCPSSGGPRNCIGKLKVAMALTLLHFELAPDPSRVPAPLPRIVLKSKNGSTCISGRSSNT
ncbi:hypothetical protein HPG69_012287, partial [Diceros bicornis minor]